MTDPCERPLKVVVWGTYDLGKPRTRILLSALRAASVTVEEIHAPVWGQVEDKSMVTGFWRKLGLALRWVFAYPGLLLRYVRAGPHDLVIVPYMGHLDVLVLWPFARLKGRKIIWDAFLSLYDTVVSDRRLVRPSHPAAWFLHGWEWLSCRAASRIALDTDAQAEFFRRRYNLTHEKVMSVFVGAEAKAFPSATQLKGDTPDPATVDLLFYGQFIPLHGIETIVRAAQLSSDRPWRWTLIGQGQEAGRIREMIATGPKSRINWIDWMPYEKLAQKIASADLCLGIFGSSDKAARVIPNKVFQILLSGRPLITRDGPAIRELLSGAEPGIRLIPPSDPQALVSAVEDLLTELPATASDAPLHTEITRRFSREALGSEWRRQIEKTLPDGPNQ